MENKMHLTNDTEPNDAAALAASNEASLPAANVPSETLGRARHLVSGWRFTRHLFEMVAAMFAGMTVLGVAIWAFGEPPGYAIPLVEYGLMGVFMSVPMVAWMRFRGHSWSDGGEMTAAMLVPMLALVLPVELGVAVPGLSEDSLLMLSHVAMIAGMVALMLYRWDRYTHKAHEHRE